MKCTQVCVEDAYQAEFVVHYPLLTVRQTLRFADNARPSREPDPTKSSVQHWGADDMAEAVAGPVGLIQGLDTKMGNDFVQGVSGGERRSNITVGRVFRNEVNRELRVNRK